MENLLSWAAQGLGISVILPFLIQLLKPLWLRGRLGMWVVWAGCCIVAAVYFLITKQVPEFVWADPAQATGAVILFGGSISALAQQWYRMFEDRLKNIPSLVTGKSENKERRRPPPS